MTKEKDTSKLWGGRFNEDTDAFVQRFTASVTFDQRMAADDIAGSLAHARMLARQGIIAAGDLADIERGMAAISADIAAGTFDWRVDLDKRQVLAGEREVHPVGRERLVAKQAPERRADQRQAHDRDRAHWQPIGHPHQALAG